MKNSTESLISFVCSCCDRAIMDPVFIGGKTYGRQCAKKVLGITIKKNKSFFVKAERISVDTESYFPRATYLLDGVGKFIVTAANTLNRGNLDDMLPINAMQVLNDKGIPLFKNLTVSLHDKTLRYIDKYGKETTIDL